MKRFLLNILIVFSISAQADAQNYVYKNGTGAARQKQYQSTVNQSILKNITLPIADSTEYAWQSAFWGIQHLNYSTQIVKNNINRFAGHLPQATISAQVSFWSMVYEQFPKIYLLQAKNTVDSTSNMKLLAAAGEYILKHGSMQTLKDSVKLKVDKLIAKDSSLKANVFLRCLMLRVENKMSKKTNSLADIKAFLKAALNANYLPNQVLVFSLQYANRDKPGVAFIKTIDGKILTDSAGKLVAIPQLARSGSNMPYYISNGNTPQGFFRMNGFGQSKIDAIGPTMNIQLAMPFETSSAEFWSSANFAGNAWSEAEYHARLPQLSFKMDALFESFYAGKAGRYEIIAHGTTVNPEYYRNKTYYPFTPTEGCLATKEIWSTNDGTRKISDQQTLVDAINKAGGPNGYFIVLNVPDQVNLQSNQSILDLIQK